MTLREEIAQQALSLAPEDRVYLADVLEQSLASGSFATAELEAAWSAEIDRRIEAYDRGEVQAVDFETALARIRQHLADHRSRKVSS
jgi:putative addiction module component (TIGR02574 family)